MSQLEYHIRYDGEFFTIDRDAEFCVELECADPSVSEFYATATFVSMLIGNLYVDRNRFALMVGEETLLEFETAASNHFNEISNMMIND